MLRSIVEYCAEQEGYRCGYCKSSDSNYSHGLWAHTLTVEDYQDLIDRGWRRSGKYLYKPRMDVTCCPAYTVRCNALEFKTSKSQKKVLKRFNKYLMGQELLVHRNVKDKRKMSIEDSSDEECGDGREEFVESIKQHQSIDVSDAFNLMKESNVELHRTTDAVDPQMRIACTAGVSGACLQKTLNKGIGSDPNKEPCKKAKLIRRERKLEKLKAKGVDINTFEKSPKTKEKVIEDFINELPEEYKKKLEIKLVRTTPPSSEWLATAEESHKVYVKYQMIIHGDRPEKCTEPKFKDFLVQSPLLEEYTPTSPRCGYGSFHQQYWLEGKLLAVGVIDILPNCVSSVYFFYDPEYMSLTLGTYGALREIEFTRQLHETCPNLKYYYMGYYIHSCRKMRYKGNFHPSYLLCPETYKWFPIQSCIPKLDKFPYCRLNQDIDSVDENYPTEKDMKSIPVWMKGRISLFKDIRKPIDDEIVEYSRLVGAKTCKSLVLVR